MTGITLNSLSRVFTLVFLCVSVCHSEDRGKEIKVGAIASLTGPAAEQGKNWLEGAQLALQDLSREGLSIRLVVEDDATTPAKVVSAFEKLASVDKVGGVIGGTWDFLAETAAPLASKHEIPFITPTNPVEILSDQAKRNRWFFTNGLSLTATKEVAKKVIDSLKPKRIAILVPKLPFGTAHADMVEEVAKAISIEVILREEFDMAGYQDALRSISVKLVALKPDFVFCIAGYDGLNIFVKELARYKSTPWILTTQHLDEAVSLSGNPSLWSRAVGIYPLPASSDFNGRFQAMHGHPPKVYSAEGYDALLFLGRALSKGTTLGASSFETDGLRGKMGNSNETREIGGSLAEAYAVNAKGGLVKFRGQDLSE